MNNRIENSPDIVRETTIKLYNPQALDHNKQHRIKSVELSDEFTRIDFIIRGSSMYINGGWISIKKTSFIRSSGANDKYMLIKATGIPYAPHKHSFKNQGEFHTYTLIFPSLPKNTNSIDIIECEAPGTYFNFYNVNFGDWITVKHPLDFSNGIN